MLNVYLPLTYKNKSFDFKKNSGIVAFYAFINRIMMVGIMPAIFFGGG